MTSIITLSGVIAQALYEVLKRLLQLSRVHIHLSSYIVPDLPTIVSDYDSVGWATPTDQIGSKTSSAEKTKNCCSSISVLDPKNVKGEAVSFNFQGIDGSDGHHQNSILYMQDMTYSHTWDLCQPKDHHNWHSRSCHHTPHVRWDRAR